MAFKSQEFSEENFVVFNSPQKPTKKFSHQISKGYLNNEMPLFFLFNYCLDARAEIRKKSVFFLGELKTPQFPSEIS